jgi:DNA-binding transcriptional LysR family regulator
MDMRQLTSFVALADDLHFSKAANRLNITQPALSQQIARLEAEVGVQLFSRNPKHVALTDAGRVFLTEANETLRHLDHAITMARRAQAGQIGRLSVAFVEGAPILPSLISAYSSAMPDVMVEMKEMITGDQVDAIGEGKIDVGILRPLNLGRNLEYIVVHREAYKVALPRRHPLAQFKQIRLVQLDGNRLITRPAIKRRYIESRFRSRLEAAKVTLTTVHEVEQLHAMIGLVGAGLGIALLPASMTNLQLSGVVYRPFAEGEAPSAELVVAWRAENRSKTLSRFVSVAKRLSAGKF